LKREIKHIIRKLTDGEILFLPIRLKKEPTHIAHICKSHWLTHIPKFAKKCNLANAKEDKI